MIDPRKLHLKIRVRATRQMSAETVRLLLDRAMTDGEVPPGITIEAIDWKKKGTKHAEGKTEGDALAVDSVRTALRKFYGAMMADGGRRFALVSKGKVVTDAAAPRQPPKRKGPFRDKQGRYRDAKGRFIAKEQYRAAKKKFTKDQEALLDEMRVTLREATVGAGAEFELTVTTEGGTPRRAA